MKTRATELWNAWRTSSDIREMAESWITKQLGVWTKDDEQLYGILHTEPDQALSVIFAAMQLSDDKQIHGSIAAGPLEDFLGIHGETYLDVFHTLALQHQRLREVLDGVWQGAMSKNVWHRIEILKQSAFS